ncbi:MAG: CinA family nicotinamide mononucleotide deamidase-related protein [Acidobacteriota bacterium]
MTHDAALVAVGTELLAEGGADTNGDELNRTLAEKGIGTALRITLPDELEAIGQAVRKLSGRFPLVIVTGGLGPTEDDVTREGVSTGLGLPLHEDAGILAGLRERYHRRGRTVSAHSARQALVLEGSDVLPNALGTAPGLLVTRPDDHVVVLLPGVPCEMRRMLRDEVLPRLAAAARRAGWRGVRVGSPLAACTAKVTGLSEPEVQHRLDGMSDDPSVRHLTILASPGEITVIVRGDRPERIRADLRRRLGPNLFSERSDEGLEDVVGRLLAGRGSTLATAESCTGGLLGSLITRVPGSSGWFLGGWVTYTDASKISMLGIPSDLLAHHGAVSEQIAREMAAGARRLSGATHGLSVTGLAGPGGATTEKPVGLVWFGIADAGGCQATRGTFGGDRETIRLVAARRALDMLRRQLVSEG